MGHMKTVSLSKRGIVVGVGTLKPGREPFVEFDRVMLYLPALYELGPRWMKLQTHLQGIAFDGDESQLYDCVSIGHGVTVVSSDDIAIIEGGCVLAPMSPELMAQDQRSTTAQLRDLYQYALRSKMFDAADWLKDRI